VLNLFLFDKISADVPSFGALPRGVWQAFGVLELLCAVGLFLPGIRQWLTTLTVASAGLLAMESVVFVWVHMKCKETTPILMSGVQVILMAFVAYGRLELVPHF